MKLATIPAWYLKIGLLAVALILDRYGMLSAPLFQLFLVAVGGSAVTGVVQALRAMPAPVVGGLEAALAEHLPALLAGLDRALTAPAVVLPPAEPAPTEVAGAAAKVAGAAAKVAGAVAGAAVAILAGAGILAGCGAERTLRSDLPAIEGATGIACTVLEGSTATSSAGLAVDVLCIGAEGLEQVTGAVLGAAAGPAAALSDAGASVAITYHRLPMPVAQALINRFPATSADGGK